MRSITLRSLLPLSAAAALVACEPSLTRSDSASLNSAANLTLPASCIGRVHQTSAELRQCVTADGVRQHQAAFQAIATANGGNRAFGQPGYAASVDYVAARLEEAGYVVTRQSFLYPYFRLIVDVSQTAPASITYTTGVDFAGMTFSPSGTATAAVTPVNVNAGNSGCNASDFAGFPAGNIALIRRGLCSFAQKASNAQAAGASAVIIFNNDPSNPFPNFGTLGGGFGGTIPVVQTSEANGWQLVNTPGLIMRVAVSAESDIRETFNLFAETKGGDQNNVVMFGSHLDSVNEGPGINDNGSGSAAILEVALQMAAMPVRNKVRFAWWGAEEIGLVGSRHYLANLSEKELNDIALYLNFDMIGSPNYILGVYRGDIEPAGSAAIEALFQNYLTSQGEPTVPVFLGNGSDHRSFAERGIPIGGLFTGTNALKSTGHALLFGGTAGAPFDPCYHQACDTFDNVNVHALHVNADAIAHAAFEFSRSTAAVNPNAGRIRSQTVGNKSASASTHDHGAIQ